MLQFHGFRTYYQSIREQLYHLDSHVLKWIHHRCNWNFYSICPIQQFGRGEPFKILNGNRFHFYKNKEGKQTYWEELPKR
jgi:hypothetical protein